MSMTIQKIKISNSAAVKLFIVGASLIFLYFASSVIVEVGSIIFVALIIAATFHDPVTWLEQRKVPRVLAVLLLYVILFLIIALIVYIIFPPLISQVISLSGNFPDYVQSIGGGIDYWVAKYQLQNQAQGILMEVGSYLEKYASGIFATVIGIFGGLISTLAILVISFYLTLNAREAKRFVVSLVPTKRRDYASNLFGRMQIKMGKWLRGQLFLMVIIGVLIYIGLFSLNVKYALILALLAGLFEIIPWLGPWLAGVIAVALVFLQSPFLALLVLILYIVVQQLENNLIVPLVMKKAVGLNPVIVIVALLIGGKLAGVLGAVLAVPSAAILGEIVRDYQQRLK